jgi:hypothetical protein
MFELFQMATRIASLDAANYKRVFEFKIRGFSTRAIHPERVYFRNRYRERIRKALKDQRL